MIENLLRLEKIINYKFKNINHLKKAIIHKSFDSKYNYENLEFLGDRVLGLIISKKLLNLYPNEKEGSLDKKLASLVNKNLCYNVAKNLKIEKFVKIGNTKSNLQIAQNKIISDCIEGVIGAIYVDGGFEAAEKFILKNWRPYLRNSVNTQIDSKTQLQEISLKKYKILPIYKLLSNTGPRHNPIFKVAVKIKNTKFIEGSGNSKKNAQQVAASNFLKIYKDELAR